MVRSVRRSPLHEQFANPAGGLAQTFRIAPSEDFVETGDRRGCKGHLICPNPAGVSGNLFVHDERTVERRFTFWRGGSCRPTLKTLYQRQLTGSHTIAY